MKCYTHKIGVFIRFVWTSISRRAKPTLRGGGALLNSFISIEWKGRPTITTRVWIDSIPNVNEWMNGDTASKWWNEIRFDQWTETNENTTISHLIWNRIETILLEKKELNDKEHSISLWTMNSKVILFDQHTFHYFFNVSANFVFVSVAWIWWWMWLTNAYLLVIFIQNMLLPSRSSFFMSKTPFFFRLMSALSLPFITLFPSLFPSLTDSFTTSPIFWHKSTWYILLHQFHRNKIEIMPFIKVENIKIFAFCMWIV